LELPDKKQLSDRNSLVKDDVHTKNLLEQVMAQKLIKRKSSRKAQYDNSHNLNSTVDATDATTARSDLPEFSPGDTVKVHVKIKEGEKERLQAFEGTIIKKSNHGAGRSFTVRKISHGVGVERIFLENSPSIGKLEVMSKGKVRRAKLYYIRGLEGRAARIEKDVQTNEAAKASAAAKATAKAAEKASKAN
jgi:large subunit ribosomal protein L19